MYVVLLTSGATSSGVTGAEFRVDASAAGSFLFQNEQASPDVVIQLGAALGEGTSMAFSDCQTSGSIYFLSFQAVSGGSAGEAPVIIGAKRRDTRFTCPIAVLCDRPTYTTVCVEGGKALLNPTGQRPCGSSREDSEWTRVKELFR